MIMQGRKLQSRHDRRTKQPRRNFFQNAYPYISDRKPPSELLLDALFLGLDLFPRNL
jgi:hypothetical protein